MNGPDLAQPLSFRAYIRGRRYGSGRGSKEGWQFVIRALGDPCLPDAKRWDELCDYLRERGDDADSIRGARAVWSSYTARLTRIRAGQRGPVQATHPEAPHGQSCGLCS
jgi:hypothetical protein